MSKKQENWDLMEWITLISKFIEAHFKKALVIFFVAVIGAGLFIYMGGVNRREEQKSFNELSKITKVYKEKKENFKKALEAENEKSDSKKPEEKKDLPLPSNDLARDYGDEVTGLETFLKQNSGRGAAVEAVLILSEIYSKYKMNEKAIQVLDITLKSWPDKNFFHYIIRMRLGNLWAGMTGGCEKALSHWKVVGEGENFMTVQAQLQVGFCFQKIGKFEEAKTWFKKIETDSLQSSEAFSAKGYLRFLNFQSQREEERKRTGN